MDQLLRLMSRNGPHGQHLCPYPWLQLLNVNGGSTRSIRRVESGHMSSMGLASDPGPSIRARHIASS